MTLTIELTSEEAARLCALAEAKGTDEAETVRVIASDSLSHVQIGHSPLQREAPLTAGAALLQELKNEGLLGLYGEEAPDSPELATELRERVWKREAA